MAVKKQNRALHVETANDRLQLRLRTEAMIYWLVEIWELKSQRLGFSVPNA